MARNIKDSPEDWEAEQRRERNQFIKWITLAVLGVIAIALFFSSFTIVGAGERGVELTWGASSSEARSPGWNWKIPISQRIVVMTVQTQKYSADASAASADLQTVSTKASVIYHLTPETVPDLYRDIGTGYQDRVIQPLTQEAVKAATAKYKAEDLINSRPLVTVDIKTSLQEKLAPRGIIVEDVAITDFDFSAEYNKAIEQKVTAEQLRQKAENDLKRIQIEADQKVAAAQAEAESLRLQKTEITPELLQLRQIEVQKQAVEVQMRLAEKWNGVLPTTFAGGSLPFLNLGDPLVIAQTVAKK